LFIKKTDFVFVNNFFERHPFLKGTDSNSNNRDKYRKGIHLVKQFPNIFVNLLIKVFIVIINQLKVLFRYRYGIVYTETQESLRFHY